MDIDNPCLLPRGIVPVIQTPFSATGLIDWDSLGRLITDAISAGVAGFLAPAVASEVAFLSISEREELLKCLVARLPDRFPLIVGASSDDPRICRSMADIAIELHAAAWLVAVPQSLYQSPPQIMAFFREVCGDIPLPLIIQDLQFGGPGLSLNLIRDLQQQLPQFQGIKIETVPAGPKYSAVREALGSDFYIAGGWAVPQMIEALDRGIDAMIPESSMVRVYQTIYFHYQSGRRDAALKLFRQLLPVLAFTNQELAVSIAFFKRLLVRKKLFASDALRIGGFSWDDYSRRIADELIEYYLTLESHCASIGPKFHSMPRNS